MITKLTDYPHAMIADASTNSAVMYPVDMAMSFRVVGCANSPDCSAEVAINQMYRACWQPWNGSS